MQMIRDIETAQPAAFDATEEAACLPLPRELAVLMPARPLGEAPARRLAADASAVAPPAPTPAPTLVPPAGLAWQVKVAGERLLAAMSLLALAPVFILIALAIRLDSPGPIFFRQPRHGRHGEVFRIHKFRTMRHDQADPTGGRQTAAGDPRVTALGHLLRRSSLDELPQLIDVLRGRMNLIGPRAHPCGMRVAGQPCERIVPWYHQRHAIAPGLTGWAQVHGSRGAVDSATDLHRRVDLDLDYIRHWSLGRDLRILVATVAVCLSGENAR